MSSSCKGSDDTVFGGRGGTGIVADIEVGVCWFSVDRCGFFGVYEDVHVRKRSIMLSEKLVEVRHLLSEILVEVRHLLSETLVEVRHLLSELLVETRHLLK